MSARATPTQQTKMLGDLAQYFYALKDGLRLQMLVLLAGCEECTVNEIAAALKKSQPLVSWHLRRLKTAGLVKIRRAGREVYCSLNRDSIVRRQEQFLGLIQLPH